MGGQSSSSFVPSVIKTDVLLNNDDHAHKDLLLQRYGERIEKLSQQDRSSKFCMDAGFLNVVETGQYFMTKDTAEFSQFTDAVACREYTLPRDEETSSMEDPVVPLERNLYCHPLAGLLCERQFEKVLLKHGWEKVPNCECLFVNREEGLLLSVYVDDIKLAGKTENIEPTLERNRTLICGKFS